MEQQVKSLALQRLLQMQDRCAAHGIPLPQVSSVRGGGLLLRWVPPGATVELMLLGDGAVRWVDSARRGGIVFDVFDADAFTRKVVEWYDGGPLIGGEPFRPEDFLDGDV